MQAPTTHTAARNSNTFVPFSIRTVPLACTDLYCCRSWWNWCPHCEPWCFWLKPNHASYWSWFSQLAYEQPWPLEPIEASLTTLIQARQKGVTQILLLMAATWSQRIWYNANPNAILLFLNTSRTHSYHGSLACYGQDGPTIASILISWSVLTS